MTIALGAAAADPRLLVLDLEVKGADTAVAEATGAMVTRVLQRAGRFDVVTSDDVRRTLGLEAERQRVGCDEAGCLEEIAGALGAELVVFGELTKLGDTHILTINLFDTSAVRSIARETEQIARKRDAAPTGEKMARRLVRAYDESRGAFPVALVTGIGGGATLLAGVGVTAFGVWQLSLLADDQANHDQLLEQYEDTGDKNLIDDAAAVQREADAHSLLGTTALITGAAIAVVGSAAVAWATWSALE